MLTFLCSRIQPLRLKMAAEAMDTDLPAEGAVQTIPKEMLLKVRPPTIEGPAFFHQTRPEAQVNCCTVVSQADVLSRHIIALERHIEYTTKLAATSTAMGCTHQVAVGEIPVEENSVAFAPLDPRLTLTRVSVSRALRHCTLVFARLGGFRSVDSLCIDMLTDLLHEFLSRVGSYLRAAQDREALRGCNAHVDSLNQALHDVGFAHGVLDVRDFVNSLRERRHRLLEECRVIHARYRQVSTE
ncbi:STAGA complex 65 subunit gamma-like [Tropilaelaps mercedesae]|uniref:STAGA complex 65 subunit gamma-like n=1 Tax=Tropilaelaps mercedesae TaxID=418985 RepID=A0A1V9XK10_9ACAR|nr:STAGA complex 65 subunit gamma-like [Tropilaelaps mercedesae]